MHCEIHIVPWSLRLTKTPPPPTSSVTRSLPDFRTPAFALLRDNATPTGVVFWLYHSGRSTASARKPRRSVFSRTLPARASFRWRRTRVRRPVRSVPDCIPARLAGARSTCWKGRVDGPPRWTWASSARRSRTMTNIPEPWRQRTHFTAATRYLPTAHQTADLRLVVSRTQNRRGQWFSDQVISRATLPTNGLGLMN